MKWTKHLAVVILLLVAGCGTPTGSSSVPFLISWQSDGNPIVPVCGISLMNCKISITILDKTTGATTTVPVTTYSVTVPNAADTYEARTDGYDYTGTAISSPYLTVP